MRELLGRGTGRTSAVLGGMIATLGLVVGAAAPATAAGSNYVALGDSYTSGQGAGSYLDTVCYRSTASYASHVDAHLGTADVSRNLACSGADTAALIAQVGTDTSTGVGLVTITVGGIDSGSNQVATACPNGTLTSTCRALLTIDRGEEKVLEEKLQAAYRAAKAKYPGAKTVVLGYPRLFGGLYLLLAFPKAMNAASDTLNRIISEAAAAEGLSFVDVRPAFRGHEIGTLRPWINYTGNDPVADFHPNAAGQQFGYYQSLITAGALPARG